MQQEDLPMERNPTYQELQKSLSSWEQKTVEYKNTLKRLEMEKQQLQEALTKSGLRFREPADLLPTIVCELDTGMLVTYMNRIGLEVFAFPKTD